MIRLAVSLVLGLSVATVSSARANEVPKSTLDQSTGASSVVRPASVAPHALAGKIYRVRDGAFVKPSELIADLAKARFVLIGETHGRRAHQEREAFLLAGLADNGRYSPVSFEMLTPDKAALAETYRSASPEYAMGLGVVLDWNQTSWPSWAFYEPVFQVVLSAKLPIRGAELPADLLAATSDSVPAEIAASWRASLQKAHCGLAEPVKLESLTKLQWRRDQAMAKSLIDAEAATKLFGAVLIAGSAHVRKDRSVSTHLPPSTATAVALLEVTDEQKPAAYLPVVTSTSAAFDYIWFTPAESVESTCERLKKNGLIK